ncbi:DUF3105 domain-containing protein [Candidatus Parcubacteria bacterium]|nr:MAG: DUF3105 domain-containing protein [Candidatus Parcubacteria bacterium]
MSDQGQPAQEGLSKKERREIKRLEKQKFQASNERRTNFKKGLKWLVVILVVAGIGYLGFRSGWFSGAPDYGEPVIFAEQFEIQGQAHINIGSEHPPYNSNPPSSGWHYEDPAPWGFYDKELPDEQLVHNLEHGGIWIAYRPDLDKNLVEQIKKTAEYFKRRIIMEPRAANDSDIALVAWGWVDKFSASEFTEKRLVDFINRFIDQGPEKIPF